MLTRAFFVINEIYMAFLLNSQAQGASGKNEWSTQAPWRGAPEAGGPMQLHRLHRLKSGPARAYCVVSLHSYLQWFRIATITQAALRAKAHATLRGFRSETKLLAFHEPIAEHSLPDIGWQATHSRVGSCNRIVHSLPKKISLFKAA